MRIGFDARAINWYKGTGIGTYTENVLKAMLKLDKPDYFHIYWSGENYAEYKNSNTDIIMSSKRHHNFFQNYYFPSNMINEKIDIFHVPQNGMGLIDNPSYKKVVTIHDLIPYVMPETVGKGYLLRFIKEIPRIIELADGILTVSEWSKNDILRLFPIDEKKIFVTSLAADSKYKPMDKEKCRALIKEKYNIKLPFILYLGGFSGRKNVKSLIIAYSKLYKELNRKFNLVIVGAKKDDGNYLVELSSSLNLSTNIIFTGFVPEELLPVFYNACEIFVYPSLCEGFGLPPLEAMSCGAPVITSNVTSIPEVVGDSGILIDPFDNSNLINAIGNLLENEPKKEELSKKGLKRASHFSWTKTAESTLKVYKKVLSST
ncbi:MAG TPA: glycosyltransferase family 1 protein [Clostridiaceae bacterium]